MAYQRFVAIGDSFTEGIGDEAPDGSLVGWADRFAGYLAADDPDFLYANLAIRGRKTPQVHDEQLAPALALDPDLASVACGVNDVLRVSCDTDAVGDRMEAMVDALTASGARTVIFTLPELGATNPLGRLVQTRIETLNRRITDIADTHGATLARIPTAMLVDPEIWNDDRLHLNPLGHARVARLVAALLEIETEPDEPVGPGRPDASRLRTVVDRANWVRTFVAPWIYRRITKKSSGDGITAKRPDLRPLP